MDEVEKKIMTITKTELKLGGLIVGSIVVSNLMSKPLEEFLKSFPAPPWVLGIILFLLAAHFFDLKKIIRGRNGN